ncbi:MAG: TetR/AcrR family transcriptional regulator [Rhodobacteraceae bacterium]|nr:TetR/AcrR family transcriptional regulator [Paracoccaceae bacterium]
MKNPPKAKTNRDAIVEAALAGFIKNGFHQTGIRDIANRAGVSLGNLYNHFSGKDALIVEIARIEAQDIDHMLAALPKTHSPMDALCALAKAILQQHSIPENAVLTADLTSEAMRNPVVAEVFATNGARIDAALTALIRDGIERGEMAPPVPVADCVALIHDTAQSSGVRAAFEGKKSVGAGIKALDAMIRRLLA